MSATTVVAAPWLSVLVPVYNAEAYVEKCLTSVVLQADEGVEVLVLDDCSSDASSAVLQSLSQRWPGRLRLMRHGVNQGQSAARNSMIAEARGEYLWFLDADDRLLPGALAGLQSIVRQHAPDVVLCDFSVWRQNSRLKHRLRGERHRRTFDGPRQRLTHEPCTLLAGLLLAGQLHAWSKISRRALWGEDLRFPVGRCFEDMAALPLMALRARSFFYEPQPWVAYRQHADSVLATMSLTKVQDQVVALSPLRLAMRGTPCENHAGVRFAMAHQCARSLIGAIRFVQQAKLAEPDKRAITRQLHHDFDAASPLDARQLLRAYARRGWWLRAAKFLRLYGVTD
ncbi:glycosyltransferase family 2 protein [Diaphorobacter sp. LR2014-1]|uniref:glycosyltransferase family 2 protein n=1 Tax=Diaphorobacter sp. LR2014-1 TaxID=1933219 RepID=UPI000CDB651E|nr:glycosyltransferase family 2 protein [Diaphorobacter sp. LR2014-1]POR12715.1 glycosyl transferase family 2 [Diaphorobacter sp. LR2014-1]